MLRAHWMALPALLALLVGCHDQSRVLPRLPPPAMPGPAPRPTGPAAALRPVQPAPVRPAARPAPPPARRETRTPAAAFPSLRGNRVVIDAGHGGKDPGTQGVSDLPEKTIVLSVANEVRRLLQSRDATVVSTRTTDTFLELDARAAIAERNQAHLFVSIHADAAARAGASGATIYIARGALPQSLAAAQSIQSALVGAGIDCRGIRRANYRVLVGHSRPAVLVECGFLTNAGDAVRLNSGAYRSRVAEAIARGIASHLAPR